MAGLYFQLVTLVVMSFCVENILSSNPCALQKEGLEDYLKLAGIPDISIKDISAKLRKENIDEHVLQKITLDQLKNAGITGLADRLKIHNFFSNDSNDCTKGYQDGNDFPNDGDDCANGNLCKNGGRCQDGFQCFKCSCPGNFYGPTCKSRCPCKNAGKCVGNSGKLECKCMPGFTGVLCEKQWFNENVFSELEKKVKTLTQKLEQSEKEIAGQKKALADFKTHLNNNGWKIVRVDPPRVLNQLEKIALHQQSPTYTQAMPSVPKNTKAIILSVFINFWNNNGHAYLNFKAYQKNNNKNGSATVENTHYNVYANTFYYEIMLPWDTALPNELVFDITSSYLTGGGNNWYRIRFVGYVTSY